MLGASPQAGLTDVRARRTLAIVDVGTLHTERLLLRRWRAADAAPFAAINADPLVMRYYPDPLDRAASDALIERIEATFDERGFGLWALERRSDSELLGYAGLWPMRDDVVGAGGVEVGWRLAARHWGRGYATEAARESVRSAFTLLGLPELWSVTAVLNAPSQAVMRRIGMRRYADFEHPALTPGHPLRPHICYHLAAPPPGKPAATP